MHMCTHIQISTSKTEEIWISYEDGLNVNTLIVILCYSFVRWYLQRKLDKGYRVSFLFVTIFLWIYNNQGKKLKIGFYIL